MRDKINVRQSAPGVFEFYFRGGYFGPVEISLMRGPDETGSGRVQEQDSLTVKRNVSKDEPKFEITIPSLDYRPYFLVREQDREYVAAERTLPVGGMNNFRDLGGYEAGDQRTVRWGMLYRSGHFHSTTSEGMTYLKKLGIHTIIDYRSKDEIEKYPNQIIGSGIRTIQLDPKAHTAELSAQFTSSKEDEDLNLVKKIIEQKEKGALVGQYDIVMEQYRNFVDKEECRESFAAMLRLAAEPRAEAVVQHCRGGKDRTGFGAMILLGLLGVDRESIVQDYMLTYENRIGRNQVKMDIYKKYTDDPEVLAYLYSLIETKPEFIEASINRIEEEYGDIEQYALRGLGISRETICNIREKYLI